MIVRQCWLASRQGNWGPGAVRKVAYSFDWFQGLGLSLGFQVGFRAYRVFTYHAMQGLRCQHQSRWSLGS